MNSDMTQTTPEQLAHWLEVEAEYFEEKVKEGFPSWEENQRMLESAASFIREKDALIRQLVDAIRFYATAEYVDVKNRIMVQTMPDGEGEVDVEEDDGTVARNALETARKEGYE